MKEALCVCIFVSVCACMCLLYIERVVSKSPSQQCGRAQCLWLWRALKLIQQCQPDILFNLVQVFLSLILPITVSPLSFFLSSSVFSTCSVAGALFPYFSLSRFALSHPLSSSNSCSLSLSAGRAEGRRSSSKQQYTDNCFLVTVT